MNMRRYENAGALAVSSNLLINIHTNSRRGTKRRRCRSSGSSSHTVYEVGAFRRHNRYTVSDTTPTSKGTRLTWKMTPAAMAAIAISMLISGATAAIPLSSSSSTTTTTTATATATATTTATATATTIRSDFTTRFPRENQRTLQLDPFQQCKVALGAGDSNRDDMLGKDEYFLFVGILATKNLGEQNNDYTGLSSFDQLPQDLKDNYDYFNDATLGGVDVTGFRPGMVATTTQDAQLTELCESTRTKILNSTGGTTPTNNPTSPVSHTSPKGDTDGYTVSLTVDCSKMIDRGQCNVDLSISDSYQNDLLDESDYVKFVNRLSSNAYAGFRFEQLPQNIKQNHYVFARKDRQVDISGSKPGDRVSAEQDAFVDLFCCETDWAVQNPGVTITEPPAAQPDGEGTLAPTLDPFFCQRSMASSDLDRNDTLNKQEYVIFLNRLTNNEYIGKSYSDLNAALQANFETLAGDDGAVSIYGSKPDQKIISVEQEQNLATICLETSYALSGGAPPTDATTPTPTASNSVQIPSFGPTVFSTLPPTFDANTCILDIALSDVNEDDYLDKDEYAELVIRSTGTAYEGLTFSELPLPLPDPYFKLASNNETGIYVYGSQPDQTPNEEQDALLKRLCLDVAIAYSQTEGWTPPPVAAPTLVPLSQTFTPGFSEGYNSFIISNKRELTAVSLGSGSFTRDGLDQAYNEFIEWAIEESDLMVGTLPPSTTGRRLRRRKLAVGLQLKSPEIYLLEDSDCPDYSEEGEICQTAFAKFTLTIDKEDPQMVSEVYTTYTQDLISAKELDIILKQVDPSTDLKIVNASYPVIPEAESTTEFPTVAPTAANEEKKSSAGAVIGWLIFVIFLFVVIGIVVAKTCPFEVKLPFGLELPSFLNRGGGRGGKKGGDDDEGGLDFAHDDDDISASGKFGTPFGVRDEDDDGDHDEEEEHKDKHRFGFTRFIKKHDEPENDFGMDPRRNTSGSFGTSSRDMYAFEEPSEADSDSEKEDDQKSVGENKEFAGSVGTPTWGANNIFGSSSSTPSGSGWGASESEDNFFAASTDGQGIATASGSDSEDSGSFSSDDDTYESGEIDDSEDRSGQDSREFGMEGRQNEESFSVSSADFSDNSTSISDDKMSSDLKLKNADMDAAIDKGDWDAVVQATKSFGKSDIDSSAAGSSKTKTELNDLDAETDDDDEDDDDDDESYSDYSESGASATSATTTTEIREQRAEYRAQVEELVRLVLPDETEKVDAMMDQFKGREAELVSTLQTMEERSGNQRARAAVHKSKPPAHQQNAAYTSGLSGAEGSTAGTAAIAAASLPIPAEEILFDDEDEDEGFDNGFGDQNAFDEEDEDQYENEGSQYSEEYDGEERSYYSGEDGSAPRSFYSDEQGSELGSDTRSFYEEEGSAPGAAFNEEEEKSYYSQEEGSAERSYYSQEDRGSPQRSYYSQEEEGGERSFYSQGEGSGERSFDSQEEGSAERSYYSQEDGGSPQRSYYSQEEEDGERSFYSQEEGSEERSFYSQGEEVPVPRSYNSQEGSQSFYSDEGSYDSIEDPDARSFYGEEGSENEEQFTKND